MNQTNQLWSTENDKTMDKYKTFGLIFIYLFSIIFVSLLQDTNI